jgi:hypothetical protein|tara:strand:- start:131 stop:349 length:219 start_codon:yes stop_codon:yes gene_type:complete
MQDLYLQNVDSAIAYLNQMKEDLNPRKASLGKKPIVWVSVSNQNDFDLLTEAKKNMRNIKWIGVILEKRKEN